MAEKSQEEFQKDVLNILKQQGEKMEGFKKEVKEKLEKKQPGIVQKEQIDKDSDYAYITNVVVSGKNILSEEAMKIRTQEVANVMKDLMKKYQISKLECFVIRNYG